ncbi:MAG: efflux RND transporter permease subunit, partial [Myxococcota bacterium]
MLNDPLEKVGRWITRHPWWVVASIVVVAAAVGAFIPQLEADFSPSQLFATFEDQARIQEDFESTFGSTDKVVQLLVVGEDVTERPTLQFIHDASRGLGELESVDRVESITATPIPRVESASNEGSLEVDLGLDALLQRMASGELKVGEIISGQEVTAEEAGTLREALDDAPLLERRLISEQRDVAAVVLFLDSGVDSNAEIADAVGAIDAWLAEHPAPESVQVRLAGVPYLRHVVVQKMRADQTYMLPAAVVIALLVLLAAFRWFPAVYLPLAGVVASVVILVGGMAIVGEPFNILNNIVPMLVIIIGIADAIHLINRYGEELRVHDNREQASYAAFRAIVAACFLTSFTTAAGFFSLLVSKTDILGRFGLTAGFGVLIVYAVTLSLIPAMLTKVSRPTKLVEQTHDGRLEEMLAAMTRVLIARPWVAAAGGTLLFTVFAVGATQIEVDNKLLDQLSSEDEVFQTTKLIEQKMQGIRALEVDISSDSDGRMADPSVLEAIEAVEAWAAKQPGITGTASPADYLHEAWYLATGNPRAREADFPERETIEELARLYERSPRNPLESYWADERSRARLTIRMEDVGAQATIRFAEKLDEELADELGGLEGVDYRLTGEAYVNSLGLDLVIRDLLSSLAVAFLIIFGFMSLVLRSVRLGALSIPPSLLPLAIAMGFMAWTGIPLNAATVIIFSITIGLVVDGTIHLLARFREEVERQDSVDDALIASMRGTGKAIILTYVALVLGFGIMLTSSFVPVQRFGLLVSLAIVACLIATLLFLPPLLKIGWP